MVCSQSRSYIEVVNEDKIDRQNAIAGITIPTILRPLHAFMCVNVQCTCTREPCELACSTCTCIIYSDFIFQSTIIHIHCTCTYMHMYIVYISQVVCQTSNTYSLLMRANELKTAVQASLACLAPP